MAAVTIEDLLRDPEPVHIRTGRAANDKKGNLVDEEIVVYLRKPTETEKAVCVGAANGARRRLRALLEDPKTDEHKFMLREPLEEAAPEVLRSIWTSGKLIERARDVSFQSLEERDYVPEPEGPIVPPAEQDAYDAEVERVEEDRKSNLEKALEGIQRDLTEQAQHISTDDLIRSAMPAHIETLVHEEWQRVYNDNVLARCTFTDAKRTKPFFKTADQVRRLREQDARGARIVQRLSAEHNALLLELEPTLGE